MTNADVVRALHELARLTELDEAGGRSFRGRAYGNAVRALEAEARDITTLSVSELTGIKGIGPAIAGKIREYVETGTIAKLAELRERYPPGYVQLTRLPGVGPRTVEALAEHLGVRDIEDLKAAIAAQDVRDVPGLGERSERKLARAIERLGLHGKERRTPIADALPLAERVVDALTEMDEVERVTIAGSLRRFRETVADIDVLVATRRPDPVTERFVRLPIVREVIASGGTKTSVLTDDELQIDLRVVSADQWGAALVYFTGSKAHNVRIRERAVRRGWTLNEYGLREVDGDRLVAAATEEEIYAALGLAFIPPGLREDVGEVEAAEEGDLPRIPVVDDLRGDLHTHTEASDGRDTLEAMVDAARDRGYDRLAITDHAEDLAMNGVSREGMLAQRRRLREIEDDRGDIALLHGSELNIAADGGLDYDRGFLLGFDWCVASVHSHFDLDAAAQTARLIAAMEHPAVNAIGHLQGRRIGRRPGIEIHVDDVLEAAERTGTAIEINSHLDRLDVGAEVLRAARGSGVVFVIDSDAHSVPELDNVRHGVRQAERGWVEAAQVVNTWSREAFVDWAAAKRGSAGG